MTKGEKCLLVLVLALLVLALFGPPVAQPLLQHDFADLRAWGFVPHAMDVLSNLPFALWGVVGLLWVRASSRSDRVALAQLPGAGVELGLAAVFFTGLLLTAFASSYYHWAPQDLGLLVDRLGMAVAFAGLLGLAAAGRVGARAGLSICVALLLLGPLSALQCYATGNALSWVVLQFGGMAVVVWLAWAKPLPGALPVRWGLVVVSYALAKLLELGDTEVFVLTWQGVSGHSLKHLVASFSAWPVLWALRAVGKPRQNRAQLRPGKSHLVRPVQSPVALKNESTRRSLA